MLCVTARLGTLNWQSVVLVASCWLLVEAEAAKAADWRLSTIKSMQEPRGSVFVSTTLLPRYRCQPL